jgi:hypothetical protein
VKIFILILEIMELRWILLLQLLTIAFGDEQILTTPETIVKFNESTEISNSTVLTKSLTTQVALQGDDVIQVTTITTSTSTTTTTEAPKTSTTTTEATTTPTTTSVTTSTTTTTTTIQPEMNEKMQEVSLSL